MKFTITFILTQGKKASLFYTNLVKLEKKNAKPKDQLSIT